MQVQRRRQPCRWARCAARSLGSARSAVDEPHLGARRLWIGCRPVDGVGASLIVAVRHAASAAACGPAEDPRVGRWLIVSRARRGIARDEAAPRHRCAIDGGPGLGVEQAHAVAGVSVAYWRSMNSLELGRAGDEIRRHGAGRERPGTTDGDQAQLVGSALALLDGLEQMHGDVGDLDLVVFLAGGLHAVVHHDVAEGAGRRDPAGAGLDEFPGPDVVDLRADGLLHPHAGAAGAAAHALGAVARRLDDVDARRGCR